MTDDVENFVCRQLSRHRTGLRALAYIVVKVHNRSQPFGISEKSEIIHIQSPIVIVPCVMTTRRRRTHAHACAHTE